MIYLQLFFADGRKEWYYHGEKHRENDLPSVIGYWCYDGKRHRMDY